MVPIGETPDNIEPTLGDGKDVDAVREKLRDADYGPEEDFGVTPEQEAALEKRLLEIAKGIRENSREIELLNAAINDKRIKRAEGLKEMLSSLGVNPEDFQTLNLEDLKIGHKSDSFDKPDLVER